MEFSILQQLGISVLLGLLVGMQREHAATGIAGMRTFPLITLLGTLCAIMAKPLGVWLVPAGMIGVVAVIVLGYLMQTRQAGEDMGTTTYMAMLVMFAVGAYVAVGSLSVAVAVGGGVAVLLQFKPELHRIAQRLGDEDFRAIMQFVLISCIILPVLPNKNFGPAKILGLSPSEIDVFNPFQTWLFVVLIVGMSLGGYIVYKFFGRDAGILLGGVLGGAISSTATTVSYGRQAKDDPIGARIAAVVIMIASTICFLRVLIEVALVARPQFLLSVCAPVGVLTLATLTPALIVWFRERKHPSVMPEQKNPTQLKSALIFGAMYILVLFALAAAKAFIGGRGLFLVAAISGLTEMDAITLSTASMSNLDPTVMHDGWRLIVVAAAANMLSKTAIAGMLGGWRLLKQIAALFMIPLLCSVALLLMTM
ncbi:MAG: MgtC/SapB family protein [Thermoguttaceae bacterium]